MRSLGIVTVAVLGLCSLLLPNQAIGQDFNQLLEAVDRLEASLKASVEQESASRKIEMKALRAELASLKGQTPSGANNGELAALKKQLNQLNRKLATMPVGGASGTDEQALMPLANDIEFLKAEISYLRGAFEKNNVQLASIGVGGFPLPGPETGGSSGADPLSEGRSALEENGITFEAVYTGELMANRSGGIKRGTAYLENGDLLLGIDAETLLGWKGASFSFYFLGNSGRSPSEIIGDAQGVSNIDADDTWKLYEAWLQQNFAEDKLSILFGLYDLNSEFDVIETGGLFLNSSFGIGPDYSQSGGNGPSIFPATSLALRVRVQPSDKFYIQTALFDGVPGDPDNPYGTHLSLGHGDGALIATEVVYQRGVAKDSDAPYAKYALGNWIYTSRFDDVLDVDLAGNPVKRSGNLGFYALTEQTVYRESGDPGQGLALFARVGFANTKINQFGSFIGGGLAFTGLIPSRDEDQLGLAAAAAINGSRFKRAQATAGTPVDASEVTLELSYRSQLLEQLAIQPDLQYVINPGTDPELNNALVMGVRFELAF